MLNFSNQTAIKEYGVKVCVMLYSLISNTSGINIHLDVYI